jgi:hypothetical protein
LIGRWLCRVGLHKWSDHRGGIKICLRDGCQHAKTFGLTGTMRHLQWQKELYEKHQSFTEDSEVRNDD